MMVMASAGTHLILGLLPVLAFLTALILLDSYKLVRLRIVAALLAAGGMAAVISLPLNRVLSNSFDLELATAVRYVAPAIEELLKGVMVAFLVANRRVGFLVDAAITGFAVGAGFAAAFFSVVCTTFEARTAASRTVALFLTCSEVACVIRLSTVSMASRIWKSLS